MSSRGSALKLALLALPLAAGTATLHAAGEPVGRAARKMVALASYPAHEHGAFVVRVRRGSDYHEAVAKTLDEFLRGLAATYGLGKIAGPVAVLVVEGENDLARLGFNLQMLEGGGLTDAASGTIAVVTGGRIYHPEQDARILRRVLARLVFARAPFPWLVSGIGSYFETIPPGAPGAGRISDDDLPALSELLTARESRFRGPGSARFAESARLLVAFLMDEEREELLSILRGASPAFLDDLGGLDARWRLWVHRGK